MDDKQIADTMRQAEQEILSLRKNVEALLPDAIAYRAMLKVLKFVPEPSQGQGIDVAWLLRKTMAEMQNDAARAAAAASAGE